MRFVLAAIGVLVLVGCLLMWRANKQAEQAAAESTNQLLTSAQKAAADLEALNASRDQLDAPTLAEMIKRVRPMSPASEASALTAWLNNNPSWSELDSIPETTIGKAAKDVGAERGKRACADGTIAAIRANGTTGRKTYEGMMVSQGVAVSFVAVGNTGDLVAQSRAKFCGIVTGLHSATGPYLVGMFDMSGAP